VTLEPSSSDPSALRAPPPKRRSPLAAAGAAIVALLAKFKFLLVFLKTGGTMLIAMWFYALVFGWRFAVGFVLLIFVHECGHLFAARSLGIKVGAPIFIPFLGAMIALKEHPRDAWMEAWIGIGGPLLGTLGALVCFLVYAGTGDLLFRALAYSGFWLNLFNLIPLLPLDGGRIAGAVSPWLWVVGVVLLGILLFFYFNVFVLILVLISLPRVWRTLNHREIRDSTYYQLSPARRWTMGVLYFGLAALLALGMETTRFSARPEPAPKQPSTLARDARGEPAASAFAA
jgi:Zn-dependent protease